MAPEYEYASPHDQPVINQIPIDIAASEMTDKAIQKLHYNKSDDKIRVEYVTALSAGDKTILDVIVADVPAPPNSVPEPV